MWVCPGQENWSMFGDSVAVMPTSLLRQNAYITQLDRFDATLDYWTRAFGAGPWYVFDVELAEASYRGVPARTQVHVAVTMLGPGQIEIIAPIGEESRVFRDWIEERGPVPVGGLFHHFRIDTDDFEGQYQKLLATGASEGVRAKAPGGRDVAYVDGTATVGSYIELLSQTEQTVRLMEVMREVCDTWDGEDPIRDYISFMAETTGTAIAGYERTVPE